MVDVNTKRSKDKIKLYNSNSPGINKKYNIANHNTERHACIHMYK